jgi:hypothetical protein
MNIANRTASLETSMFFSPAMLVASSGMGFSLLCVRAKPVERMQQEGRK